MSSSTAATAVWPSPGRFALGIIVAFTLTLVAVWAGGRALIEAMLPITRVLLGWLDDRFDILFLGVEHNWQDTVIRLRMSLTSLLVMGGQVITPHSKGWIEASTPIGDLLQPLVIATGFAAAWPGNLTTRLQRLGIALSLSLLFLIIDIPLTLHAVVWDMLTYQLGSEGFSPLLVWWQLMQAGGRLGVGMLLGMIAWRIERRVNGSVIG